MIPNMPGNPAAQPGAMQGRPAGGSPSPVRQSMSPTNGADKAYMQSRGIDESMSIKNYIETVYKVPVDAPMAMLKAAVQKSGQNATMQGKAQNVASQSQPMPGRPAPSPRPMPQQPGASAQGQSPRGMAELSQMMGSRG